MSPSFLLWVSSAFPSSELGSGRSNSTGFRFLFLVGVDRLPVHGVGWISDIEIEHCCFGQYRYPAIHGSDDPEAAVNLSGRVSPAATLDLAPRVLFVGEPELRPSSPIVHCI
ncbi:hypothetical protein ZIOFF_059855 [Zingiber officinale]|uniref:Uncharacterized protein n=1 Tax=Zingiber officinale TaxID=94328 RepID=A0A8J5KN14_ZINOF|nr:hypothetical protein ZIOFF_059855 [Zingiber officinale]